MGTEYAPYDYDLILGRIKKLFRRDLYQLLLLVCRNGAGQDG